MTISSKAKPNKSDGQSNEYLLILSNNAWNIQHFKRKLNKNFLCINAKITYIQDTYLHIVTIISLNYKNTSIVTLKHIY